jgi:citrate lyase subunit beta/citryl-CoA lyase
MLQKQTPRLQPQRPRRCQLSVPGSSEKMLAKAASLAVDSIILDLEDAVAPSAKEQARALVSHALTNYDWQAKTVSVRINATTTPWCHDDVIELLAQAGAHIHTLVLAKTNQAADVQFLHLLLDQLEQKLSLSNRIGIEGLIEDVSGLVNIEDIATASDRLESLIFGMGDYSASQHMRLDAIGSTGDYPPDIWHYPRYKLITTCHAYGLDPIDGPFADFKDLNGLQTEATNAATLGMFGKWAIHPSQAELLQTTFAPSNNAISQARKQKSAFEQALSEGKGAIAVDGVMVDAASIRLVQNLLDRAELYGL